MSATTPTDATIPVRPGEAAAPESRRQRRRQTIIGLVLVAAIIGATFALGQQLGFNRIGQGGVNQKLLPKVGQVAPPLMALDVTGKPVRLSDFRGKPVWLSFWGSWCGPCRSELPDVETAYKALSAKGVVFMSIACDEPSFADAVAWAVEGGATFPILNIPARALIAETWPVYNLPTHLFIDANGVVRFVQAGPIDAQTAIAQGEALLAQRS